MKILLLEDDPDISFIYTRQLQKATFEVDAFSLGKDAVDAATKSHYDIALIDVMLPDTNGIEVIKQIKQLPTSDSMTIIMLSNMGNESIVDEAKKIGADDYLIKSSMNPEELIEQIKHIHETKNNIATS